MKIKKIAAVCRTFCRATIWDQTDTDGQIRQWIVTGVSCYPVECLPYITEEHLETLLDLSAAQAEKVVLGHENAPDGICLADTCDGETLCTEKPFSVVYGGKAYNVYFARGRAWFINFELLTPILAEHKDAELWLRTTDDMLYCAVKAGLLCVGIVLPAKDLENLADMLTEAGKAYEEAG